jgi:hypothetical protein
MKIVLKKRSIEGYVNILKNDFRLRCAKYSFSVNYAEIVT